MAYLNEKWQEKRVWVFSKQGIAVPKYAEMVSAGNYFNVTVDMSHVAEFPSDLACYCSTDHDSVGQDGIYMSYLKNGSWVSYDDGLAAGDFDGYAVKPTGNPIFRDVTSGTQCETPFIKWVEDMFVMTYQMSGAGTSQSTLRAISTDGLNFTVDGIVLDYDTGVEVGDGHTGYLRWGLNKFPDVNYKYVGYALHGGQVNGFMQLVGCDDPRTENWSMIAVLQKQRGDIFEGTGIGSSDIVNWNTADVDSVHQVGRYWFMLCAIGAPSAGAGAVSAQTYWLPLADDGYTIVGSPIEAVTDGETGEPDDKSAQIGTTINDQWYYDANTEDNIKTTAYANIDTASGEFTKATNPLLHPPLNAQEFNYDFTDGAVKPNGIIEYSEVAATIDYTDEVLLLSDPNDGAYLYSQEGFIPNNVEFVEWWVTGIRVQSSPFSGEIMVGFGDGNTSLSAQSNGIRVTNGDTEDGDVRVIQRAGGVDIANWTMGDIWGFGWWNSYATRAPKSHGIRWYPQEGKGYLLGESGMIYANVSIKSGDIDMNAMMYPYIGLRGVVAGNTANHIISSARLRVK